MEKASARTPWGPRRPPTPWTGAPIWARCRSGWGTRTSRPPGSTTGAAPAPKTAPPSASRIEGRNFVSDREPLVRSSVLSPCPFGSPVPARLMVMDKSAGKASWRRRGDPLGSRLHFFSSFVPTTVFALSVRFVRTFLSDLLHPPTSVSLASLGPGVSPDGNRQKASVPLVGTPSA